MTTIYFARHGTTDYNRAERFQGTTDIPLNDLGLFQADCLGKRFHPIHLDAVYSSPLIRAQQTAQGICKYHPELSPICVPDLCELNGGIFEGQPIPNLIASYPDLMESFRHKPAQFAAPGGETAYQVYTRIRAAVHQLIASHPNQTIVVVSHGFALLTYLGTLTRPFEELEPLIFGNAAVACVEYHTPEQFHIVFMDDQSHLPPESRWNSRLWPKGNHSPDAVR